jgi:hypothetical protein
MFKQPFPVRQSKIELLDNLSELCYYLSRVKEITDEAIG